MTTYVYRGGNRDGEVETANDLVRGKSWRAKESATGGEMGLYLVTSDREQTDAGSAFVIRFMPDRDRTRVQVWLQHDDVLIDHWQVETWDEDDVADEYVVDDQEYQVKGIAAPAVDGFGRTVYRLLVEPSPSS